MTEPLTPRELYEAYCSSTGGKSAVTGAALPDFDACNEGVRKAWQAVADHANGRVTGDALPGGDPPPPPPPKG